MSIAIRILSSAAPFSSLSFTVLKRLGLLVVASSLVLGTVACGDDEGGSKSKTPAKRRRSKAAPKPKVAASATFSYPKVSKKLRRELTEVDFIPDASGETNRDPFRSWTLRPREKIREDVIEKEDICASGKVRWGARDFSFRSLVLVGIVKRGRSYAQFVDRSGKGSWVVRKGDCLGQEKAVLEDVGVGFVRLVVTPPAPPGGKAPSPQRQDISLHPDELALPDSIINNFEEDRPQSKSKSR